MCIRDRAVCARIGQELLFVECLYEIERLLGSEAVVAVRLALQGGQIIELRRVCLLYTSTEILFRVNTGFVGVIIAEIGFVVDTGHDVVAVQILSLIHI